MSRIVYSGMVTPDGTLLESRNTHNYVKHKDANGETYMLDGGCSYVRCSVNIEKPKMITLHEDDPIEIIRNHWNWGSYGVDGDQPLSFIKLKDMEEDHMDAITINVTMFWVNLFDRELDYRDTLK